MSVCRSINCAYTAVPGKPYCARCTEELTAIPPRPPNRQSRERLADVLMWFAMCCAALVVLQCTGRLGYRLGFEAGCTAAPYAVGAPQTGCTTVAKP